MRMSCEFWNYLKILILSIWESLLIISILLFIAMDELNEVLVFPSNCARKLGNVCSMC
jgi:hypothetical protein